MRTYNRSQTSQKSPAINVKHVCRLCMGVNVTMHDIFDITQNPTTSSLASKILTCLSIEVKDHHWFPSKLCVDCWKSLDAFAKFREQCHLVNKKLQYLYETTANSGFPSEDPSPFSSPVPHTNQCFDRSQAVQQCSEELNSSEIKTSAQATTDCTNAFINEVYFSAVQNVTQNSETGVLDSLDCSAETSNGGVLESVNDLILPSVAETTSSDVEEGEDALEIQVSMNGSSYVIEVLEETSGSEIELSPKKPVNDLPKDNSTPSADLVTNLPPPESTAHQPSYCKNLPDTCSGLKEPKQKHAKGFSCQVCSKWFSCKSGLQRHEKIHSGEKPYNCSMCSRSFSQREVLSRHLLTHSGDKPYKCSSCEKSYTQKESLNMHVRNNHLPRKITEIDQYKCSLCDKAFCHLSGLSRHQQSHAGIKYPCKLCDRVFTDQSCLKRHNRRVHLKENNKQ